MRTSSFFVLVVFLILGILAADAAGIGVPVKGQDNVKGLFSGQDPVKGKVSIKGQDPVKGQGPIKGPVSTKPGVCPQIQIRCAMMNPPNHCLSDAECPGAKKCCVGSCGRICVVPL